MTLPEELIWIQHLIDHHGVSGTLRLVAINCFDRRTSGTAAAWRTRWGTAQGDLCARG
jgi:hypothetical protein